MRKGRVLCTLNIATGRTILTLPEATIEDYFNAEEIDGARKYIEVFHGKLLVSNNLSRSDAVLLSIYMLSNFEKSSEISKVEAKNFATTLGTQGEDFSKGLYDVKQADLVSESDSTIGLTFNGLKKVRQLLTAIPQGAASLVTHATEEGQKGAVPPIGTPASVRDAVGKLLSSGWGSKPKNFTEIMDALELNAIYYPKGTVSKELGRMTQQGVLRRLRSGGQFAYVYVKKPSAD